MDFSALQLIRIHKPKVHIATTNALGNADTGSTRETTTQATQAGVGGALENHNNSAISEQVEKLLAKISRRETEIEGGVMDNPTSEFITRILKDMASTSVWLLYFSFGALFAGIFTFIWSNQTTAVAVAVTVVFGVLCIKPFYYLSILFFSLF